MKGESSITRSVIDELHSWHIQRDQMAGVSSDSRRIMDELIFRISKEIK